ncbi:MAG: TolC family protein [Paludibacteraceae bacterium]
MTYLYKKIICFLFLSVVIFEISGQNVTQDSLTLQQVLSSMLDNSPVLKKVDNDLQAAGAKISLTKTAYLPDVNLNGSYSHIGPVSSIAIPDMGKFQLFPADNYAVALNINENIYDFGRTNKNVVLDLKNQNMIQMQAEQIKQRLSAIVINYFYNIGFLQEAVKIKDEQLNMLTEHLDFVQKKAETGSATQYEILTTKVKISAAENQKTDLLTALEVQTDQLNTYLNKPLGNRFPVRINLQPVQIISSKDILLNKALENRIEMKMAKQKEEISKSKLDVISVQNNPSVNAFGTGGFKNGFIPDLNAPRANYAVGVGVKIPLFDANRSKYVRIQVQSEIADDEQDTELARQTISNEVTETRANAEAALKKINQSELQLNQAMEANKLAEVNYKAGSITNLDLMDSYTAVSESKLALFKTRLDYTMNLDKLKLALGETIH